MNKRVTLSTLATMPFGMVQKEALESLKVKANLDFKDIQYLLSSAHDSGCSVYLYIANLIHCDRLAFEDACDSFDRDLAINREALSDAQSRYGVSRPLCRE